MGSTRRDLVTARASGSRRSAGGHAPRGATGDYPDVLTSLHYPRRARWQARAEYVPSRGHVPLRLLTRLLLRGDRYRAVVLGGSGTGDRLVAMAVRRLRPGTVIVLTDCTWKRGRSRTDRTLGRLAARALDGPRVCFCVLSTDEAATFRATWGIRTGRVEVTPWFHGVEDEPPAVAAPDRVFAGGDSLRDYRPLLAAAAALPQLTFRIAARGPLPVPAASLPPNINAGPVSPDQYVQARRPAAVVVVPLAVATERSAGQALYLDAMALGKVVVVSDATGVRDYVQPDRTGLVVPPGDPAALAGALRWCTAPDNRAAVAAICAAARREARTRFSPDRYVARLLEVVDAVAGPVRPLPPSPGAR